MKSFLIVEDDATLSKLTEVLIRNKYGEVHVSQAFNGQEALEKTRTRDYTVIITDLAMPEMSGEAFYKVLKNESPHLAKRILVISAYMDTPQASYIIEEKCACITKPYEIKTLYSAIDSIIYS